MHRMKINTTPIAFYNNSMKHLYQLDLDKKTFCGKQNSTNKN